MKKIVLAALAVLSLGAGVAQAQTYGYERAPAHNGSNHQNSSNGQHSESEGGG